MSTTHHRVGPPALRPDDHALRDPGKSAVIMGGSGRSLSYQELVVESQKLAVRLREAGFKRGDHIAILLENQVEMFTIAWAAHRLGLYYTPINWHLHATEIAYIVTDSGARLLFASANLARWLDLTTPGSKLERKIVIGAGDNVDPALAGFETYETFVDGTADIASGAESEGQPMYYSSGTTGRPKGIKRALTDNAFGTIPAWEDFVYGPYEIDSNTVYLCPAPLYHAAPLSWSMAVQRRGGSVILMENFDPREALRLIESYGISHTQMVPTHFVRMLKLPEQQRKWFDTSSLRYAIHAAAPCPVEVKKQMLAWWGPIIHEFYGFSEGSGFARIGPGEWLQHPGSVGKPTVGKVSILDDGGKPMPAGVAGQIWFEDGGNFAYHNDPEKTAAAYDSAGRTTVGDIGYLDEEGFLYLTDRAAHMIISGGVNIYPQEIENYLILHHSVADVAVIGVPDEEFGEQVKAVVVADGVTPGQDLADELIAWCRERLAGYKCPRSVDFVHELPRLPTGKLLKRQLRERYWP